MVFADNNPVSKTDMLAFGHLLPHSSALFWEAFHSRTKTQMHGSWDSWGMTSL